MFIKAESCFERPMKISVLMSVFNADQYLRMAIESILNQTFSDFEFIIINDGSTDNTANILASYNDPRIVTATNEVNIGLTKSLNKGLDLAQGEYIARMDADDISMPNRLGKQVAFMDTHPEIGVCGSWARAFGDRDGLHMLPDDNNSIKCRMLFQNSLVHSSVIIRKSIIEKYNLAYDEQYSKAQDYALWLTCLQHTRLANIPDTLVGLRFHKNQTSILSIDDQDMVAQSVRQKLINKLGIHPSNHELSVHETLIQHEFSEDTIFFENAISWLNKLHSANNNIKIYPEPEFSILLTSILQNICNCTTHLGFISWLIFEKSTLSKSIGFRKKVNLFIKHCLH